MLKTSAHIFSGGGGGTLGTEKAGFKTLWSLEKDAYASSVHRANCSSPLFQEDIRSWNAHLVEKPTLLVAGPPCTNFSTIGDRTGIDGNDGQLSLELVTTASILRSPFLLIENVAGLLSLNKGIDFFRLIAALDAAGYSGVAGLIDGRHYVPQSRVRVYIQCIHKTFVEKMKERCVEDSSPGNSSYTSLFHLSSSIKLPSVVNYLVSGWMQRCNSFKRTAQFSLSGIQERWSEGYGCFPGLRFAVWHNDQVLGANAYFEKFPYVTTTLPDILEDGAKGVVFKTSGGDRVYTDYSRTIRGMNHGSNSYRQPGTGAIKVINLDGSYRSITATEVEKLMGWPVGSTSCGFTGVGEKICLSTTQRVKMLSKGMIPDAIAHMCEPFVALIDTYNKKSKSEKDIPLQSPGVSKKNMPLQVASPLKWVGGKSWVREKVAQIYYASGSRRWFDPFCGSLCLPLGIDVKKAYLADSVWGLINFWKVVQSGKLCIPDITPSEGKYLQLRSYFNECVQNQDHDNLDENAAVTFYFLNRMGYQGLCRHNRKGGYNVPYGHYKNPTLNFDAELVGKKMHEWRFYCQDYTTSLKNVLDDDFVLIDPPYYNKFSQYGSEIFSSQDQVHLANLLATIHAPIVAFNSSDQFIVELYKNLGFKVYLEEVTHMIGARKTRPKTQEMIAFKNFDILLEEFC